MVVRILIFKVLSVIQQMWVSVNLITVQSIILLILDFREILAELECTIASAEFLAIDGEFTGLHNTGQNVNAFDTPSQYYSKLHSSCMDFLLIQFGLCIFRYDEENDKYTHRAYNFYIFPQAQSRYGPDATFLCQSSSIKFLSSQGFDFNKLFKEGIPYLTQPEEQKLRECLEEKYKSGSSTNVSSSSNGEEMSRIPIPEQHVSFIEDVCSKIQKFLESSEPEELEFDRCNAFLRKLIFQEVGQRFGSDKIVLESRVMDNNNRVLVATRTGSEEMKKQKEKEKMERELKELEDAIGFSTVIKIISKSGKLVVGHNMLLDICHVVHQCYFPLPASYSEFKELIGCVFPKLLDTKYMSYSSVFKESVSSNVLEHLHKTLSEKPFKLFSAEPEADGLGYSSISEKYHEAGYDAYITGLCFIAMANHIGSLQKPEMYPVLSSSPLLNPYVNRLFLMRVQDSPYINLVGQDPELPRNHVFHISFPKEWKSSDITQLFSPFGPVFIAWINETSAFVALYKRDQASVVKKILVQSDVYTLMTYAAYQELQDGRTECHCASSGGKSSSSLLTKIRKRLTIRADLEIPLKRRRSRLLEFDGRGLLFPQDSSCRRIEQNIRYFPSIEENTNNLNLEEIVPNIHKADLKILSKLFKSRRLSFTYLNRSFEVIPEEQGMFEFDFEVGASNSQDNPDDGASSSRMSPIDDNMTTNRRKEFKENDSWG